MHLFVLLFMLMSRLKEMRTQAEALIAILSKVDNKSLYIPYAKYSYDRILKFFHFFLFWSIHSNAKRMQTAISKKDIKCD